MNNKINSKTRIIRLFRDGSTQLGFSIRGGWEHGTGIFVSEVHPGSEASKQGLQAGDQIVRINGFSLEHAIHDDVIALVKSTSKITLKVKSVGMIPIRERLSDILTWKLIAPSTSPSLSSSPSPPWTSSDSHSDSEHDFLEANIFIDLKGKSLGCSVVKGLPNNPGIFVQNVKCGEIADQSGLEIGDQIIQVNGIDVSLMDFSDAIYKLKSLPSMTLTVRKGAGRHMFDQNNSNNHKSIGLISHYNNNDINDKNFNNINKVDNNCILKKKVTAIVHHPGSHPGSNGNNHSRMLSTSSNCSEQSSSSGGLNGKTNSNSDNDFSISELDTSADSIGNSVHNINKINLINNNNNNNNNLMNESQLKILEKVKQEEERLADERRKLEEEQQKLKIEMIKLQIEKKELERRKQSDECKSLSNCSISSASNSSSGSQSISFLEEIKALGDHSKRHLKPVKGTDRLSDNKTNNTNENISNKNNSSKLVTPISKCDNNDKHKQHELLMEEFRRAHRRMFGDNDNLSLKSDKSSTKTETTEQNLTKDSLKETKSLPTTTTITPSKTPPVVPVKKTSGPVVQIGTYANNSLNNNRFVTQTHRSVIQVRSDDTLSTNNSENKQNNSNNNNTNTPQITIKVISTKQ